MKAFNPVLALTPLKAPQKLCSLQINSRSTISENGLLGQVTKMSQDGGKILITVRLSHALLKIGLERKKCAN